MGFERYPDVTPVTNLIPLTNDKVRDKMAGMNRFDALARGIFWLSKRGWGLSLLLAFVSFCTIVGIASQQPTGRLNGLFEGPLFRFGIQMGAVIFPDYTTRGTNGFYLVPLFGAAMDFLALMAFWSIAIGAVHRLRAKKGDLQQS